MHYQYDVKGTCTNYIEFDIEDGLLKNVVIRGGCHGKTQGICRLLEGRSAEETMHLFEGITCGENFTSCPDQVARSIRSALGLA